MTAHPDVETLSSYLDGELKVDDRIRLEDHLDCCDQCRHRLSGLQRVVGHLSALERLAPPPHLGAELVRLSSLQETRPGLVQRLEQKVGRIQLQSGLFPVFATIMALVLIIYLLSWGVHRRSTGRIPVDLQSESTRLEQPVSATSRQIEGRLYELVNGVWVEEGLEAASGFERLSGSDPRVLAWISAAPARQELIELGGPVRLVLEGEVVEIRFDPR